MRRARVQGKSLVWSCEDSAFGRGLFWGEQCFSGAFREHGEDFGGEKHLSEVEGNQSFLFLICLTPTLTGLFNNKIVIWSNISKQPWCVDSFKQTLLSTDKSETTLLRYPKRPWTDRKTRWYVPKYTYPWCPFCHWQWSFSCFHRDPAFCCHGARLGSEECTSKYWERFFVRILHQQKFQFSHTSIRT